MPKIIRPVDLESQMIISMNHFMCHCVLEVPLVIHFICAEEDSVLRIKSSSFSICASTAVDIMTRKVTPELPNVIAQIANDGA